MAPQSNQRPADLEEIFADGNLVLLDSSAGGASNGKDTLSWTTYSSVKYRNMSPKRIREELTVTRFFMNLLDYDNACTTENVHKEKLDFLAHLGGKITHVEDITRRRSKKAPGKGRGSESERLFRELHDETFDLCRALKGRNITKRRDIYIDPLVFPSIFEAVTLVQDYLNLKKDTRIERGRIKLDHERNPIIEKSDSRSDEELVSLGFYASMFSQFKPVLFSSDGDFYKLISVCSRIFGASDFSPQNDTFVKAMGYNPVQLYGRWEGEIAHSLDASKIDLGEPYRMRGIGREPVKEKIINMFENINSKLATG
jgi:hypothetical protein